MKAAKEGENSLSAAERTHLGLDSPLGAQLDAASLKDIEDAHCGAMPKSAFGGMAYAQRYRDAHLADAVLKASESTWRSFSDRRHGTRPYRPRRALVSSSAGSPAKRSCR